MSVAQAGQTAHLAIFIFDGGYVNNISIHAVGPYMDGKHWLASTRIGGATFKARGFSPSDALDALIDVLGENNESGVSTEVDGSVAGEQSCTNKPPNCS